MENKNNEEPIKKEGENNNSENINKEDNEKLVINDDNKTDEISSENKNEEDSKENEIKNGDKKDQKNKGGKNLYSDEDNEKIEDIISPTGLEDNRSDTGARLKKLKDEYDIKINDDEEPPSKKAVSYCEAKAYLLEPEIYQVMSKQDEKGKVKSIVTILSVWNTMIGSSSVTMPKFVKEAGIIPCICNR